MTGNDLLKKMGEIEDSDILLSETLPKRRPMTARWFSAAAAVLVLGVGIFAGTRLLKRPGDPHQAQVPTAAPTENNTASPTEQATDEPIETEAPATERPSTLSLSVRLMSAGAGIPEERVNALPKANEMEMLYCSESFTSDEAPRTLTVTFEGVDYSGRYTFSKYYYNSYITHFYSCGDGREFGINARTGELNYLNLLTPELLAAESGEDIEGDRYRIVMDYVDMLVDDDYDSEYYPSEEALFIDGVYQYECVHRLDHSDTTSYVTIRLTPSGKLAMFRVGDIKAYPTIERETELYLEDADIKYMIHVAMRELFDEHGVEYPEDWFAHTVLSLNPEGKVVLYVFMDVPIAVGDDTLDSGFLLMVPDISEITWYWETVSVVRDAAAWLIFGDIPGSVDPGTVDPQPGEADDDTTLFGAMWKEATEEQKAQLDTLRGRDYPATAYVKEILTIMGYIPEKPCITLLQAKELLEDMDPANYPGAMEFESEIIRRFSEIAGAADVVYGSGVSCQIFYTNASHTEYLHVGYGAAAFYDREGNCTILKEYSHVDVPDTTPVPTEEPQIPED